MHMSEVSTNRTVQAGQPFEIDLEALPGAGYMWGLAQIPEGIELLSHEVIAVSPEVGGPSTQRFRLKSAPLGRYVLVFELKRSWEKDPVKTTTITVTAE
jgi:predicted secreted protein